MTNKQSDMKQLLTAEELEKVFGGSHSEGTGSLATNIESEGTGSLATNIESEGTGLF